MRKQAGRNGNGGTGTGGGNGPSIADVARAAGVATSTVSRALTKPGRIAEPTRTRVLEAAQRLGYTANQAARNLRVGTSRTIMIVLPEGLYTGASQVVAEVLRGVAATLTNRGYSLVIANLDRLAPSEAHILELAHGGSIAGVLIMASLIPESGGRSLAAAGLPIVSLLYDLGAEGIPSVVSDERAAIDAATRALVRMGHRRFCYVSGPCDGNYHEVERRKGVHDALAASGIDPAGLVVFEGDFLFQGGVDAGHGFLALAERPTAAICANDDMAISFIKTVMDHGLAVPGDVSVLGFDGAAVGRYISPSLSTIGQATHALGARAASLLLDRLAGEDAADAGTIVIPCTLELRDSVRALE